MTDLVSRLLEAITAKEEKAHAAIEEAASRDDPEGVTEWYASPSGGLYYKDTNNCFATGPYGGDVPTAARTLIVDNDPSSVLRRCAADRAIVQQHSPDRSDPEELVCGVCIEPGYIGVESCLDWPLVPYPCPTLRWVAAGYGLEVTE